MFSRGTPSVGVRSSALRVVTPVLVLIFLLGLATPAIPAVSYLQNGTTKIGVDLSKGGSITYLANMRHGGNLVNSYDLGRQIQQSYYSGPRPFSPAHSSTNRGWTNWPWNPIQSGDSFGHAAKVLQSTNDGKQLYVKTQPLQWALNKVLGEAVFETWIHLDGPAARVRCRLTNSRTDNNTQYPGWHQESPAIYTVASLPRLVTYLGDAAVLRRRRRGVAPGRAAVGILAGDGELVGPGRFQRLRIGRLSPRLRTLRRRVLRQAGEQASTGSVNTGYMAPLYGNVLDHNIVFEYQYDLIVGTLGDIRGWVYKHQPDPRPTTASSPTGSTGSVPAATPAFRSVAGCGSTWPASTR